MGPMNILWITNGYNRLFTSKDMPLPSRIQSVHYHSAFVTNFNLNFLIIAIPLIVGLIFYIIGKIKDKTIKITGYRILK